MGGGGAHCSLAAFFHHNSQRSFVRSFSPWLFLQLSALPPVKMEEDASMSTSARVPAGGRGLGARLVRVASPLGREKKKKERDFRSHLRHLWCRSAENRSRSESRSGGFISSPSVSLRAGSVSEAVQEWRRVRGLQQVSLLERIHGRGL